MKQTQKKLDKLDKTATSAGWMAGTGYRPSTSTFVSVAATHTAAQSTDSQMPKVGQWLDRVGLWELVCGMMRLSQKYDLPWKASWQRHLNDPTWLGRAMAMTFEHINPQDQGCIGPLYGDWLWFEKHVDMQALVEPEYNALCYLLDKDGKRICRPDGPVTVLRGLKGQDKQQALASLDRKRYEFKAWW